MIHRHGRRLRLGSKSTRRPLSAAAIAPREVVSDRSRQNCVLQGSVGTSLATSRHHINPLRHPAFRSPRIRKITTESRKSIPPPPNESLVAPLLSAPSSDAVKFFIFLISFSFRMHKTTCIGLAQQKGVKVQVRRHRGSDLSPHHSPHAGSNTPSSNRRTVL